jgi:predicted MarR family transcription regulator
MEKRKVTIINNTQFKTEDISEIAYALLESQLAPSFYLVCCPATTDGLSLTNLDKPTMLILVKDLHQFAKVFVHELAHLQQHAKGYVDEKEASAREIVVSDFKKTTIINGEP